MNLPSLDIGVLTHIVVSFRQVPAFGETTIRRFDGDVSEMKRLAGHDFEDILQVGWHLRNIQSTVYL